MHESSVIQYFERKATIESILDVLDVRFQHSAVQMLKPTLEGIKESQRLKELLREAVQVSSLDEFKRILAL
ncbi:MAG: hypothetical protein OXU23_08535 [Candidatus Poribacteria bacterium]|nr:hypothetical protein [Candidatus Poribacteria bacterium]